MSAKALDSVEVELAAVPFSEKGLSDLAKALVESGSMSAHAFNSWCSRMAPLAVRWERSQQQKEKPALPKVVKPSHARKPAKERVGEPSENDQPQQDKKPSKNDLKLAGFIKVHPDCAAMSWKDIRDASKEKVTEWYHSHHSTMELVHGKSDVHAFLSSRGLVDSEINMSKAWFPYFQERRELYVELFPPKVIPLERESATEDIVFKAPKDVEPAAETTVVSQSGESGSKELVLDPPQVATGTSRGETVSLIPILGIDPNMIQGQYQRPIPTLASLGYGIPPEVNKDNRGMGRGSNRERKKPYGRGRGRGRRN